MLHVVLERIARLEKALADTSRKIRILEQFAKAGVWEFDLVNNKLWWSSEVYQIFGQSPETFAPSFESFLACIPENDREQVRKSFLFSLDSRSIYKLVHRIVLPSGDIKYVEEHCETRFNANGKPLYSIGTCQDITEKQQALFMIEESANRFKEMVSKAPLAYVGFDHDGVITMVNERFEELVGESAHALIGKPFYRFLAPEQVESFTTNLTDSKYANGLTADLVLHRTNLEAIEVAMTIKRYTSSSEKQAEYHGILLDITYINQHQLRIKEKNKHLLNIAWEQSHILRRPVSNLLGILPLINEEVQLSESQQALMTLVQEDLSVLDGSIHHIVSKCSSVENHAF